MGQRQSLITNKKGVLLSLYSCFLGEGEGADRSSYIQAGQGFYLKDGLWQKRGGKQGVHAVQTLGLGRVWLRHTRLHFGPKSNFKKI